MDDLPCDPRKDAANIKKHGISLQAAKALDFRNAAISEDKRFEYPETRWRAIGKIDNEIYYLVFARTDRPFRPISLRKAKPPEVAIWNAKQANPVKQASKSTKPTKTTK